MNLDLLFAIIFYGLLILFFLRNRKRFTIHGKIFALYKTKLGLNLMDKLSKKVPFLKHIGLFAVFVGFFGMILIFYELLMSTVRLIKVPTSTPSVVPLLPGIKAVGLPVLSFWHWIIAIFVLAVVHEFSHGIFARLYNVKVKSSGFAFLGPILDAFVEPDEKVLVKRSKKSQLSIYASGSFANFLTALLVWIIYIFLLNPFTASLISYEGVKIVGLEKDFPAELVGISEGDIILKVDNKEVKNVDAFKESLKDLKPGDEVLLETKAKKFKVIAVKNPNDENRGYIGVFVNHNKIDIKDEIKAKYGNFIPKSFLWLDLLLFWIFIANVGVGLFNLLPLGPIDGGKMFYVAALAVVKDEDKAKKLWGFITAVSLMLIFINLLPWFTKLFIFLFKPLMFLFT